MSYETTNMDNTYWKDYFINTSNVEGEISPTDPVLEKALIWLDVALIVIVCRFSVKLQMIDFC